MTKIEKSLQDIARSFDLLQADLNNALVTQNEDNLADIDLIIKAGGDVSCLFSKLSISTNPDFIDLVLQHSNPKLLNVRFPNGQSLVGDAIKKDNPELLEKLLSKGANIYDIDMYDALEKGVSPNGDRFLEVISRHCTSDSFDLHLKDGRRPLRRAVEEKNEELLRSLLSKGAKPIPKDKESQKICYKPTLIHTAVEKAAPSMLRSIINAGGNADIAMQGKYAFRDHISHFARTNCFEIRGKTALHSALEILSNDPSKKDQALEMVSTLVRHGVRTDIRDDNGLTARDIIHSFPNIEIKQDLQNIMNGSTPLHNAINLCISDHTRREEALNSISTLIREGAQIDIRDGRGASPLDILNGLQDPVLQERIGRRMTESHVIHVSPMTPEQIARSQANGVIPILVHATDISSNVPGGAIIITQVRGPNR